MKCPDCNAHNADAATFCSLCMRTFVPQRPTPAPVSSAAVEEVVVPPTGQHTAEALVDSAGPDPGGTESPGAAAAGVPGAGSATKGRIRRTDEGFDWQCDRCASWTPLEMTSCRVCSRPFRAAVIGADDGVKLADMEPMVALGLTAVLPGAGHIAVGRTATGLARMGLFLVWGLGAVSFVSQSSGTTQAPIAAIPLGLGALILWAMTFYDLQNLLAGRDKPLLNAQRTLWLVTGVFATAILAMLPAMMSVRGDTGRVIDPVPAPAPTDAVLVPAPGPGGSEPEPAPTDVTPGPDGEPPAVS